MAALWEEGSLMSPGAKQKWFWSVGLDGCASFLVVTEGVGGSCRGKEGGGFFLEAGKKASGFCTGGEGGSLVSRGWRR